jgi:hypothetical protein
MIVTLIPGSGVALANFKAEIVRSHDGYGPHRWSFDIPTLFSNKATEIRAGAIAVSFANACGAGYFAAGERD